MLVYRYARGARLVELFETRAALCGPGVSCAGLDRYFGWMATFFFLGTYFLPSGYLT